MKFNAGGLVIGVVVAAIATTALLLGAYSAASAPLPKGFPPPSPAGKIEIKQ